MKRLMLARVRGNSGLKLAGACIFLCIVVILGLCSCELIMEAKYGKPTYSKVNILVYGNDYYYKPKYKGTSAERLQSTINDVTQVGLALEAWAKKAGIECQALYVTGKEYSKKGTSGTIPYVPEDRSDHNTTKAHFRALMQQLADRSQGGELTFIFFSCHGYNTLPTGTVQGYRDEKNTAFVMCGNSGVGEECELYWHAEFGEDLGKIRGAKVVFSDVCHSGGIVDAGNVSVNTAEYAGMSVEQLFLETDIFELPDTFCLAASRYYELSYESSLLEHGLFTESLLGALGWDEENQCLSGDDVGSGGGAVSGSNGALGGGAVFCVGSCGGASAGSGGRLTFLDLCQRVVREVPRYNSGQHPMLSGGSNDLILFDV